MQLRGNDMIINKGENFTIDITLKNRDDSPYILSKELQNPRIRITFASAKYDPEKIVKEFWLPLDEYPARFYNTVPVELSSWTESLPGYDASENLYYVVTSSGQKQYKYWDGTRFVDYDFRIVYTFSPSDTLDLVEQNYFYNVLLYSGELSEDDQFIGIDTITTIIPTSKLSILSNLNGGV